MLLLHDICRTKKRQRIILFLHDLHQLNMLTNRPLLTQTHTPQASALGLDPARTIVELLPLLLLHGNCFCGCVCAWRASLHALFFSFFYFFFLHVPASVHMLPTSPSHYPVGPLLLLHPATNMHVSSPSVLSPLGNNSSGIC